MKRRIVLITITALLAVLAGSIALFERRAQSIATQGALPTKDAAINRVRTFFDPGTEPMLFDARLVYLEQAYNAIGAQPNYERPGYRYQRQTPMWAITMLANDVSGFPMFEGGKYMGAMFLIVAGDGKVKHMASVTDPATDPHVQKILALPDLDGQVEIVPIPTPVVPEMPPTSTPVPVEPPAEGAE